MDEMIKQIFQLLKKTFKAPFFYAVLILVTLGLIFKYFIEEELMISFAWPLIVGLIVNIIYDEGRKNKQKGDTLIHRETISKNSIENNDIKNYIVLRLDNQIEYYDETAIKYKKWHERITIATIIISAIIALIPALNSFFTDYKELFVFCSSVAAISITIMQSIDKLKKYEELYYQYRTACEKLKQEKYLYLTKSGEYKNSVVPNNDQLFVERCESIMATENGTWAQLNEKKKD